MRLSALQTASLIFLLPTLAITIEPIFWRCGNICQVSMMFIHLILNLKKTRPTILTGE